MKKVGTPSVDTYIKSVKLSIGANKDFRVICYTIDNSLSKFTKIVILSLVRKNIKDDDLIGKDAIFEIDYLGMKQKYKSYVATLKSQFISKKLKNITTEYVMKEFILYDKIYLLSFNVQSRVFKIGNPADVIKEIFKNYDFKTQVKVSVSDRKIMCQYNESDYDFLCRICNVYNIGYYLHYKNNEYIIHDKESYDVKFTHESEEGELEYQIVKHAENSKIEYTSRTQWSTNTIKSQYYKSPINSKKQYFNEGYSTTNTLKDISLYKYLSLSRDTVIHYNTRKSIFAGSKLNDYVIYKVVISHKTKYDITSYCMKSGIEIPELKNIRGNIVSMGFTQMKADKIKDNQEIIDSKTYEVPVKMIFDDNNLIVARQPYTWLGKFYGASFQIREQTEVMVLFLDPLMSVCSIVNCYSNDSNSEIFKSSQTGIKTATIGATTKEEYMNLLMFQDKKHDE
jgi:hypothetical protein